MATFGDLLQAENSIEPQTLLKAYRLATPQPAPDEVFAALQTHPDYFEAILPPDVAQFMGDITTHYQPQSVLDPHCGLGQLLTCCPAEVVKVGLNPDEAQAALASHLFPTLTIEAVDPLTYNPATRFDTIIMRPPFGQHIHHDGRQQPLERLLLNKALALLNTDGVLVVFAPGSVLTTGFFELFRHTVREQYGLDMIVTLPVGTMPQLHIESCVLVIRKGAPRPTIYMAAWETGAAHILDNLQQQRGDFQIAHSALQNRWDRHFYDPRFTRIDEELAQLDVKPLQDLGEVFRGYPIEKGELVSVGDYRVLTPQQVEDGVLLPLRPDSPQQITQRDNDRFQKCILQPGDIVVSLLFDARIYIVAADDPPAIAAHTLAVIRADDSAYIAAYLGSSVGLARFQTQIERRKTSAVVPQLSLRDLRQIRIPLLPLADRNRLGDGRIQHASAQELVSLKDELGSVARQMQAQEAAAMDAENRALLGQVMAFVDARFNQIDGALQALESVTAEIMSRLNQMQSEIQSIKDTPRSDEEKIARIYQQLDTLAANSAARQKTEADYRPIVEQWLWDWDRLSAKSQTYLVSAEFLLDEIYRVSGTDYSPFVLQYCRALENEMLEKICVAYHEDVYGRYTDPEPLIGTDYANRQSTVNQFARAIKKNQPLYTLGQIHFNLNLLKPKGNTFKGSPLLQDFRTFLLYYFDDALLSQAYLDRIDTVIKSYRNKAAHPYLLNLATAQACQTAVRDCLNDFLGYRNAIQS